MNYLKKNEQKLINTFLKRGYLIGKVENKDSLNYIEQLIKKSLFKLDRFKEKKKLF